MSTNTAGGGTAVEVRVDPHGLAQVGRQTRDVAAAMPGEALRIQGPSDEAAEGLRGWRTEAALVRCTRAWVGCLRELAAEVAANGADMIRSADNYSAAELSVHSALRHATEGR